MSQQYLQERRADSVYTLVPITAIFVVVLSLFGMVTLDRDLLRYWSLWLNVVATPFVASYAWNLLKEGRTRRAAQIFIGANLLLLFITYVDTWTPRNFLPFAFGIFVIISSLLVNVYYSFLTWAASFLLCLVGLPLGGVVTGSNLLYVLLAGGLNFLLALAAYLAAMDWEMALTSVSELQRRAQQRRDELFDMKEQLSQSNARLHHANLELERARQAAIHERDLRTRFMNNVSHELRTPLNAVVNFAHILASGGRGEVSAAQVDYLSRIEQAGEHVLQILNDLLDLAQIESGEFKLYLEPVDLHKLCEEVMSNARGLLLGTEVDLVRDYPEQWPWVEVDRVRLKQALLNLIGNAAKYTEEGYIALRVRPEREWVHLLIEDSGVGIAPKYHELIFQEFRQVDETPARRRIGTGLGLPITRHLIERHGGLIGVESDVGTGSTFTVSLPVWVGEEPAVEGEGAVSGRA